MSSEKTSKPQKAKLAVLRRRAEFLAVAAHGKKWVAPGVIVQFGAPVMAAPLPSSLVFYGLTASRKVGNAIVRNKARRRLRALAQEVLALHAKSDQAYVLIARPATALRDFDALRIDIITALKKMKAWRE